MGTRRKPQAVLGSLAAPRPGPLLSLISSGRYLWSTYPVPGIGPSTASRRAVPGPTGLPSRALCGGAAFLSSAGGRGRGRGRARTRPPDPRPRPQINGNHLAGEPHAPPPPPGPPPHRSREHLRLMSAPAPRHTSPRGSLISLGNDKSSWGCPGPRPGPSPPGVHRPPGACVHTDPHAGLHAQSRAPLPSPGGCLPCGRLGPRSGGFSLWLAHPGGQENLQVAGPLLNARGGSGQRCEGPEE